MGRVGLVRPCHPGTGGEPVVTYTVHLPSLAPLSLNDRGHWTRRAGATRDWREIARLCVKADRVPRLARADIRLVATPPDRRRRDRTNLSPTYKAVVDGVVDAGVIPDDTPEFVDEHMPELLPSDGHRLWRWQLVITGVPVRGAA